ncbi:F0F1 ATP synthase subunit delta [Lysobacter korlensis]|uniref:ATP synthase subunit delta n=1 Tax=Lysobacter korlensis TaxID=553636 RepID=A0ABV6RRX1_9GAMM
MSEALTLARPYARAAFSLAHEAGRQDHWTQALRFAASVAADPRVAPLISHPQFSAKDAAGLLAVDDAEPTFGRFLELLANNHRLGLLPEIAGLFEQLRAEAEHIVKARVVSAAPMQPAELEAIRAALKRRFGREVDVETSVDESLIGGALIDAGDVVIDGSLRGKLERLQSALAR